MSADDADAELSLALQRPMRCTADDLGYLKWHTYSVATCRECGLVYYWRPWPAAVEGRVLVCLGHDRGDPAVEAILTLLKALEVARGCATGAITIVHTLESELARR